MTLLDWLKHMASRCFFFLIVLIWAQRQLTSEDLTTMHFPWEQLLEVLQRRKVRQEEQSSGRVWILILFLCH